MSEDGYKLPIENDRELLAEYGRVFAWINYIEYLLQELIIFKGKLNLIDLEIRKKLIEKKTLGQKIELAKTLIDISLFNELKQLNVKRILFAHSITAQEVVVAGGKQEMGRYTVGHDGKEQSLDLELMNDVIGLAQSVHVKLHNILLKETNYMSGERNT